MTSFLCVSAAWLLSYLPLFIATPARAKLPGGYDNNHPREQAQKLEGHARRAIAAHQNSLENFPAFAAAVIVAHLGHGHPGLVSAAAVAYVAVRVVYIALYVFDVASARTIAWMLGMAATGALFLSPFVAPAT